MKSWLTSRYDSDPSNAFLFGAKVEGEEEEDNPQIPAEFLCYL